jgi:hypothetical protein
VLHHDHPVPRVGVGVAVVGGDGDRHRRVLGGDGGVVGRHRVMLTTVSSPWARWSWPLQSTVSSSAWVFGKVPAGTVKVATKSPCLSPVTWTETPSGVPWKVRVPARPQEPVLPRTSTGLLGGVDPGITDAIDAVDGLGSFGLESRPFIEGWQ